MKDITIEELRSKLDGRPVGVVGKRKEFAVLIPLIEEDGEVKLLFEVRSKDIRQPGDVCFPGGKIEEGESETEAALMKQLLAPFTRDHPIKLFQWHLSIWGEFCSYRDCNKM